MHFVVRWGEPVRYVEFYPNVVQSIYRMRGISTVGPDDSGEPVRYVEFYPNVVQSIYRMRGISTVCSR